MENNLQCECPRYNEPTRPINDWHHPLCPIAQAKIYRGAPKRPGMVPLVLDNVTYATVDNQTRVTLKVSHTDDRYPAIKLEVDGRTLYLSQLEAEHLSAWLQAFEQEQKR